ncbi:MAG: hypothetical protein Q9160_006794 [Pyrenula sp. 1 TL-2023]
MSLPLKAFVSLLSATCAWSAAVERRATPSSIDEVISVVSSVLAASPSPVTQIAADYQAAGIGPAAAINIDLTAHSYTNNNPNPPTPIYPKKSPSDAPYSVSEATLRGAIHIPPTFKFGSAGVPTVLFPGTASTGATYFYDTGYATLLKNTGKVDPVWINVPGNLLGDAQVNAEYAAYAVNYISAVSKNKKVAVVAWSQGNIDAQWAYKYWPSVRSTTVDHIAISPDYHGSTVSFGATTGPQAPALLQQKYNANFIRTLRNRGGDSALVPTTTLFSAFDEVVQPQSGTNASAFLGNANGAGVTNNQVQVVCPGQPAGGLVTHEGMGYNSLLFSLLIDAVTHDGPGQPSRLNLPLVCALPAAPGLTAANVLAFEGAVPIALAFTAANRDLVTSEPPIKSYAA